MLIQMNWLLALWGSSRTEHYARAAPWLSTRINLGDGWCLRVLVFSTPTFRLNGDLTFPAEVTLQLESPEGERWGFDLVAAGLARRDNFAELEYEAVLVRRPEPERL